MNGFGFIGFFFYLEDTESQEGGKTAMPFCQYIPQKGFGTAQGMARIIDGHG
jgi:hypothetical protein